MNSIRRFLNTWAIALTAVLALAFMVIAPLFVDSFQSIQALASPEPGDYRSIGTGTWDNAENWQVWNGDNWESASTWPGENEEEDYHTVTIQKGHIIDDNNVSTLSFGNLIIHGQLNLSNNLYLESTTYVIVDGGSIVWLEKLEFQLPTNAVLGVINIKDEYGTVIEGLGLYGANNKMRLVIGTVDYAAAVGGGNVIYTFDDINENGGILTAIATADPEEFNYEGSSSTFTTTLAGEATGLGSGPEDTIFTWEGTGPDDFTYSHIGQNPGLVNLGNSAGTYTFTLTVESNFDGFTYSTSQDAVVVINHAPLTITALDQTKEYGETFTFDGTEFMVEGLKSGDSVNGVTLTSEGAANDAGVGSYDIIPNAAYGTGLTNYTISYVNGTLQIGDPNVTITVLNQSKEYGTVFPYEGSFTGTAIDDLITYGIIEIDGLQGSATIDSINLTSAGAAATATVTGSPYAISASNATGSGLENYTITYIDGALTVNPSPLAINVNSTSKTYGNTVTLSGTEFNPVGLVNGDKVTTVNLTCSGAAATATVAGSPYAISASDAMGSGLENYTITYIDGALTVNPRSLAINVNSTSKTYGDAATFSGTEFNPVGIVNGDTVTTVNLTSSGATASATVAGSPYAISASNATGSGLENYTITYIDGALTISKKELTITAQSSSKIYGDTITFTGTEFTSDGLVNGDTVTTVNLTCSGAAASAAIGTYTIIPSEAYGTGLDNYTISYANGTLSVTEYILTITALDQTKEYGNTFTFEGNEFTVDGLRDDDRVDNVSLTSEGAPATATVAGSRYSISASNATGSGLENYTIIYVDGDLTINPKPLTIAADSSSKTYGDTIIFSGTEFTSAGLVNSDTVATVDLTCSGTAATATVASSPYSISISNAQGTGLGNYTITYIGSNLTVDRKSLTITANSSSKTYGDTIIFSGTEFTSAGLINNDTVTSITIFSNGAPATASVAGSPYAIVAGNAQGTGLGNYIITYVDGVMNIDPKALTITAQSSNKTYGDTITFTGTEFTSAGLVNDDTVTFNDTEFIAASLMNDDTVTSVTLTSNGAAATATVTDSPYPIIAADATGTGLDNYEIIYEEGTLRINPMIIHVTANPQSKTYGDPDPALTYTYSPELLVDDTFTGSLSRVDGEDEGNYIINQGTLALSSNYILDYTGAELTVISFDVSNMVITSSENETWGGITFTRETGNEVLITLDVSNTSALTGTYHGILKLNGDKISSKDITLEAGESGQLIFNLSDLPSGNYTVEVADLSANFSRDKWTNLWLISNLILTVIFIGYLIKRYAFKRNTEPSI